MGFVEFAVFCIILWLASWQAYSQGVRTGTSATVDKLHEAKIIAFDNEGNIVPNMFFDV